MTAGTRPGEGCGPSAMGWLGALTDLFFAAGLSLLLSVVFTDHLDQVPRRLALLPLFGAPGIVAACGILGRRRSLVAGAGVALLVGAPLSFTGVTVVFLIPAALLLLSAARLGPAQATRGAELLEGAVVAALLVGAGIALFGLTADACADDLAGGNECGTGVLTTTGVVVELALQATAIVVAAWRAGVAARLAGRPGRPAP